MSKNERRSPGIADVAERANVSTALVSRILSGDKSLRTRESTRERVLSVAQELRYVPYGAARSLRLSQAGAIGLIVHDISNPIHAEIIQGAQAAVAQNEQVLLLAEARELASNASAFDRLLGEGRVDGLLWHGGGEVFDNELVVRAAEQLPTLLVNSQSRNGIPAVRLADTEATVIAMNHLLELGHERIAYIGGRPGTDLSERRRAGWSDTLEKNGLRAHEEWMIEQEWDSAAGYDAMNRLLLVSDRPTAALVANVIICVGALAAAQEQNVRVPDDLSMITVHDAWFAAHSSPPLTTMRLPLWKMGKQAAELLLNSSDRKNLRAGAEYVIGDPSPELLSRGSTKSVSREIDLGNV